VADTLETLRPYKGAARYYSRFRPPYPPALVTQLRDKFGLDGTGRLLDLGCGPGSVAIPLAHLFGQVVAADREPDMLAEGRARATEAGASNIEWLHTSSEELTPRLGVFRLVTMGESFHWMDRERTLDALYELVSEGGGIAIVGRGVPLPLPPLTPWRAAVCKVIMSYV
jgi:ubiquinone/menaquinone biosynthesis C-methylase UbiE